MSRLTVIEYVRARQLAIVPDACPAIRTPEAKTLRSPSIEILPVGRKTTCAALSRPGRQLIIWPG
jgi:hypothetical protein